MWYMHGWALLMGGAALAVPFAVHWLTRPRPRPYPFSAIKFLREIVEGRNHLQRLRDGIVLTARVLAVAALAALFSRPFLEGQSSVLAGDAATVRLIIVDVSQSMAARHGGFRLVDEAKSRAASFLSHRPGLRANLLFAAASPRVVFESFSGNFGQLREELKSAVALPERLNVNVNLRKAHELFRSEADQTRLELFFFSDFQASNWAEVDLSVIPAGTHIEFISVAPEQPLQNLAIRNVSWKPKGTPDGVTLTVEVDNHSATPQPIGVEVEAGGSIVRMDGNSSPHSMTALMADLTLAGSGWTEGKARLTHGGGALVEDDIRHFVVYARNETRHGLISSEHPDSVDAGAYFLKRALSSRRPDALSSSDQVTHWFPEQLDDESLRLVDLLWIDHPDVLSATHLGILVSYLRRGGALVYLTTEPADRVNLLNLQQSLGEEFWMPIDWVSRTNPPHDHRRLERLQSHLAPLDNLSQEVISGLQSLKFAGGLDSKLVGGKSAEEIPAAYQDGVAALATCRAGGGVLSVWNLDLAQSEIRASPLFVPFLLELATSLLNDRAPRSVAECGEPFELPLSVSPARAALLSIKESNGEQSSGQLIEDKGAMFWRTSAAGQPGVMKVLDANNEIAAIARAIPNIESRLEAISSDRLSVSTKETVRFISAAQTRMNEEDRGWKWFALICIAAMLIEIAALRFFRT